VAVAVAVMGVVVTKRHDADEIDEEPSDRHKLHTTTNTDVLKILSVFKRFFENNSFSAVITGITPLLGIRVFANEMCYINLHFTYLLTN